MMSCKDLAKNVSSGEEIGLIGKMKIKIHTLMCDACEQYVNQINKIGEFYNSFYKKFINENKDKIEKLEKDILESIKDRKDS